MKYSKLILCLALVILLVSSCKQNEEARRPLSQASGEFMKKSVETNKKLVATEEQKIDSLIKSNPKVKYMASTKGYWYTYVTQNIQDTLTPKKGDVAFFDYELQDLKGNIIYSEVELRPQTYLVDKQNSMTGLREGIKLMHKNEKIIFLFPSHIAYGYHGDNRKIGPNEPLMCTVTLHNFMPEATYRKEVALRVNTALPSDASPSKPLKPKPAVIQPKDTLNP